MSVDHNFVTPRHGEPYGKPKVSVVIATRNEYPLIYTTLFSCIEELLYWGYPFEIIIVSNLCDDGTPDILDSRFGLWKERGRLKVVRYNEKGSASVARNKGVEVATGDVIYFSDAHVSLKIGTLHGMIQGWLKHGGAWQTCVNCWSDWDDVKLKAYELTLDQNFWGNQSFYIPPWAYRSDGHLGVYTIPMAGYASILVGKNTFNAIHGFHPAFKTYGGEEGYLSMKMWRLGVKSWMYPDGLVRHDNWGVKTHKKPEGGFSHSRGYSWTNEDVWHNFMLAAFTVGGNGWIEKIYRHCVKQCNGVAEWIKNLTDIRDSVIQSGYEDKLWIQSVAVVPSLDQLLMDQPWNDPDQILA